MNPDTLFFTSDTHFGHRLCIDKLKRPFESIDAMDAALVRLWNETVPEDADVFHLGDVSFRRNHETVEILKQLHGRLWLIEGNHDRHMNLAVKGCFMNVAPYAELRVENTKVILMHFPIASWHAVHHGAWHLHGHSHGSCQPIGRRFDVGVDCNSLRPVSFRELVPIMGLRPIASGDGHTAAP